MAANREASLHVWQRIIRDTVITILGAFMLVWQTVFATTPNALVIGAGLVLLGLPPAFRVDQAIRGRTQNLDEREGFEDKWSHLP